MALRCPTLLVLLALAVLGPARLSAQRVYWDPSDGTLGFGKTSELRLVFEDCGPAGEVALPRVDGLRFGRPSTSTETTVVNFSMTRRTVLAYPVQPDRRGAVSIPAFDVRTNIGLTAVGEARFTVGDPAVGTGSVNAAEIMDSQLAPAKATVWAGEVVGAEYRFLASPRYNTQLGGAPEWAPAGAVAETFGEPERIEQRLRGERWPGVLYRTRFAAAKPGRLELDPVQQAIQVQTGERAGFFFSQPRIEEFNVLSTRPEIDVRPLPEPAPAGFTGAVGRFRLESTVVPRSARIGDPVTWSLRLSGVGNWPAGFALPEREISADFEVVQPKSRQEMEPGSLFTGTITEDAVLLPTKAGSYTVGPVRFTYFDTEAGRFRTLETEPAAVTILPAAAAPEPPSEMPAGGLRLPSDSAPPPAPPAPEARPLPADLAPVRPVPGWLSSHGGGALAPFATPLPWWLATALLPPLLVWIALAWRHALRHDPARGRRLARLELLRLLRRLVRSSTPADAAALEGWRIHAARFWGVARAVPTAGDLRAAMAGKTEPGSADAWAALWAQAERALFGPPAPLPSDWPQRALAAAERCRPKRSLAMLPLRWRHWAPPAALALCAGLAAPPPARADDASLAYHEGRFEDARALWSGQLRRNPHDWALRNNIALAYAQQERWPEAAATWTSAFLLAPRAPSLRANLRLSVSRLDGVDPYVRRLVDGSALDRAVTTLAPAEWQIVCWGGAAAVALGLALMAWSLHRERRQTAWRRAGLAFVVAGIAGAVASTAALRRFGPLADLDAAIVVQPASLESIPSDLAERQQKAPVPVGTVVLVGRAFLGWNQVGPGGSTTPGWLRRDAFIPLWRAPDGRP